MPAHDDLAVAAGHGADPTQGRLWWGEHAVSNLRPQLQAFVDAAPRA
ncbi:MAG: hypothetical protein ACM3ML_18730 [Micromonosporaceae bacterium]